MLCNIPSSETEITAAKIMFMQSDTDLMPHLVGARKKWTQEWKEIRDLISAFLFDFSCFIIFVFWGYQEKLLFFPFYKFTQTIFHRKENVLFLMSHRVRQSVWNSSIKDVLECKELNKYTKKKFPIWVQTHKISKKYFDTSQKFQNFTNFEKFMKNITSLSRAHWNC